MGAQTCCLGFAACLFIAIIIVEYRTFSDIYELHSSLQDPKPPVRSTSFLSRAFVLVCFRPDRERVFDVARS